MGINKHSCQNGHFGLFSIVISTQNNFTPPVAHMGLTGTRVDAALKALPGISATDLKRNFANVFRNLGPRGSIAVANHQQLRAVIVGVEEYIELLRLRESVLGSLEAEFDRRFAAMQTPGAAAAADRLFGATPAELGAAAVAVTPQNPDADA
jgi:PHD/YefM family antitoxin component YafN of YafNO toxin-antitoxin module